jgi:uncharacterized protein YkwD
MTSKTLPRFAAIALALALASCAGDQRRSTPLDARSLERLEKVRVDPAEAGRILNAYRASRGLGPVRLDPALTMMAQRQVDAMVAGNALSHTVGGNFTARVHAAGIDAARTAENLAGGAYSTAQAFEDWRKSPGHDANLLMREATRFGIALAKDPATTYRTYWALVIASDPEQRRELSAGPVVTFGARGVVPR